MTDRDPLVARLRNLPTPMLPTATRERIAARAERAFAGDAPPVNVAYLALVALLLSCQAACGAQTIALVVTIFG